MATFRTDRETGRTVISSENQVGSDGMTDLERADVAAGGLSGVFDDPRFSEASRDPRGVSTFNAGNIASVPLTFDQFMTSTGRSATNPYGDQGFFSRALGIDPSKISYANNIPGGGAGIAQLNALAYDRYMNPAARTNIFGDQVGGDPTTGQLRYGVQSGDLTRFGRAVPGRREGIAGVLDSLPFGIGLASRMFGSTPARVPGFDAQEVVPQLGLGGPQPGEGVDPQDRFPQGPFPTEDVTAAAQDAGSVFDNMDVVPSTEELIAQAYQDESLLQGPPELQMDEIGTPGMTTIQGTLDFPGTQQDRRFRATSTGTGMEAATADELLNRYLQGSPLYDLPETVEVSDASNFLSPTMDQLRPVFRGVGETLNMNLPGFDTDPNKPRIEPFYEQEADRYGVRLKIPFHTMVG